MIAYPDLDQRIDEVKEKSSVDPSMDIITDHSKHLDYVIPKKDMIWSKGFKLSQKI